MDARLTSGDDIKQRGPADRTGELGGSVRGLPPGEAAGHGQAEGDRRVEMSARDRPERVNQHGEGHPERGSDSEEPHPQLLMVSRRTISRKDGGTTSRKDEQQGAAELRKQPLERGALVHVPPQRRRCGYHDLLRPSPSHASPLQELLVRLVRSSERAGSGGCPAAVGSPGHRTARVSRAS